MRSLHISALLVRRTLRIICIALRGLSYLPTVRVVILCIPRASAFSDEDFVYFRLIRASSRQSCHTPAATLTLLT